MTDAAKVKAFPVMEVFGPTIQGEGPDAGRPCLFVRFGGCDYRCDWCDSLHAVLPKLVRAGSTRMTANEIVDALDNLIPPEHTPDHLNPMTVVLSGGNPVLHDLEQLCHLLYANGYRAVVETQGSKWKRWLTDVALVVCSPKPPSSLMTTDWDVLDDFVRGPDWLDGQIVLKVVCGNEDDYQYAKKVHLRYPWVPFYLSVLNPAGSDQEGFDVNVILEGYRLLCERVAVDPDMRAAKVLPQLHTLAWGAAMGV